MPDLEIRKQYEGLPVGESTLSRIVDLVSKGLSAISPATLSQSRYGDYASQLHARGETPLGYEEWAAKLVRMKAESEMRTKGWDPDNPPWAGGPDPGGEYAAKQIRDINVPEIPTYFQDVRQDLAPEDLVGLQDALRSGELSQEDFNQITSGLWKKETMTLPPDETTLPWAGQKGVEGVLPEEGEEFRDFMRRQQEGTLSEEELSEAQRRWPQQFGEPTGGPGGTLEDLVGRFRRGEITQEELAAGAERIALSPGGGEPYKPGPGDWHITDAIGGAGDVVTEPVGVPAPQPTGGPDVKFDPVVILDDVPGGVGDMGEDDTGAGGEGGIGGAPDGEGVGDGAGGPGGEGLGGGLVEAMRGTIPGAAFGFATSGRGAAQRVQTAFQPTPSVLSTATGGEEDDGLLVSLLQGKPLLGLGQRR